MGEILSTEIPRFFVEMVDIRRCFKRRYVIDDIVKAENRCKTCKFCDGAEDNGNYRCSYEVYITEPTHGKYESDYDKDTLYWKQFVCARCGELVKGDVSEHHNHSYCYNNGEDCICKNCGTMHIFLGDVKYDHTTKEWIAKFAIPVKT